MTNSPYPDGVAPERKFECTVGELQELMKHRGRGGHQKLITDYGSVIELCRRLRSSPTTGRYTRPCSHETVEGLFIYLCTDLTDSCWPLRETGLDLLRVVGHTAPATDESSRNRTCVMLISSYSGYNSTEIYTEIC